MVAVNKVDVAYHKEQGAGGRRNTSLHHRSRKSKEAQTISKIFIGINIKRNMKTIIFVIAISLFGCSRNSDDVVVNKSEVVIHTSDMVEGRQTYTVVLGDTIVEHMYAEEIAQSLITGVWGYNEDLKIKQ